MKLGTRHLYFTSLVLLSLVLSACRITSGNGTSSGSGGSSSTTSTIGGTITGLSGSGLVLQDNTADNLAIGASGPFTFATAITNGKAYSVTVMTQPTNPAQVCVVTGGNGTAAGNVTTVQVSCSAAGQEIIGGQVTGLVGSGLVLQDNSGDNLTVKANGGFTFATPIASGGTYNVTVLVQPTTPSQTCTVAGGTGTATGNVGTVVVTCSAGTLLVGGSVSGLAGTGLVLQDNGGDNLKVSANGAFQFATLLVSGATYSVTIQTQPTGPTQSCTVTNGTGTATANVSNVQIVCPAVFHTVGGQIVGLYVPTGQTSNMVIQDNGGDNLPVTGNGPFTFVTPIANGSAYDVTTFVQANTQSQGCIIWGYTGVAVSNVTNVTVDCGHNDWTWMDGPNTANQDEPLTPFGGNHAKTQDTDSPGGSKYSASWTDSAGNLWLFTGSSHAAGLPNVTAFLGEMWVYTGTQSYFGGLGNYWTKISPVGASPTPRWGAVTWTDASGNFWLFGGQDGGLNFLNDLWTYNPSANTWTYVAGGFNQTGTYGTKGTPSPANLPGGRWGATARRDAAGNVWLFGGYGLANSSSANTGLLNDLWKYTGGQWTWMSGSNVLNQDGVYGTQNVAAAANVPGGRQAAVSWTDNSGNYWLFGGYDLSPTGQPNAFNDLWEFNGSQWAWVSGANVVNQTATYGTQGVAAASNVPGARWSPAAWSDSHGDLWLIGGFGYDATGDGSLADVWEFKGGQWIWVKGPNSVSQAGVYGIQANPVVWPHVTNFPGSRWGATSWIDPFGQFWMFGGEGFDSTNNASGDRLLSDLWRYLPYP